MIRLALLVPFAAVGILAAAFAAFTVALGWLASRVDRDDAAADDDWLMASDTYPAALLRTIIREREETI